MSNPRSRRRHVSAVVLSFILTSVLALAGPAQTQRQQTYEIHYRLGMPEPASHLFEVHMDISRPGPTEPDPIDLQIPKWQPGRYSIADFAKNVQEFSVMAENGPLSWTRIDDQTWRIQTRGAGRLTVAYKVFGNDLSGTFAQLDLGHANYTGGEIFMYAVGHKSDPVELRIEPPSGWHVINGRTERPDQREWRYPNYETLIDNPTEIGPDWTLDEFKLGGRNYRVVIHSRGNEGGRRPFFIRDLEKIVRAETAMWGPPEFQTYTFMFHFAADGRSADGMEHLVSTQIILPGSLAERNMYERALRTAAHEFFHAWNVKRLRPAELGPWDWTKPVATRSLWIVEGFTQYYGALMLHRAGLDDDAALLQSLSRTISTVENSPGVRLMSAEDSSMLAPFLDAALHRQRTNLSNTSVSYYLKGELIAFNLDLWIRGRTKGQHSLDDVMRRAYEEFYEQSPNANYYLKGRGYTIEDFMHVVSEIAGTDMNEFFTRYIHGTERLPYEESLAAAGLRLVKSPASEPFTGGMVIDRTDRQQLRLGNLQTDSPAERGGLQQGDLLLSIGGIPVSRENWVRVLNRFKTGDRIPITIRRLGRNLNRTIQLGTPEVYTYAIEEKPDASSEARAIRSAWFAGK